MLQQCQQAVSSYRTVQSLKFQGSRAKFPAKPFIKIFILYIQLPINDITSHAICLMCYDLR